MVAAAYDPLAEFVGAFCERYELRWTSDAARRRAIASRPSDPWLERDRFRIEARADDPRTFLPRAPRKARTISA